MYFNLFKLINRFIYVLFFKNIMDWEEFFKPTIWKVVLTVTLLGLGFLLGGLIWGGPGLSETGLPLPFVQQVHGRTPDGGSYNFFDIAYIRLIIDIVFWYLISCLIFIKKSLKK